MEEAEFASLPPAAKSGETQHVRQHRTAQAALDRLVRSEELWHLTGLKKSAVYAGMKEGSFPKSVRIGARSVAWRLSEIQAWISSRPGATGSDSANG